MARITVEDCLEKVENRFSLVHLAVRRVLQLRSGAPPLTHAPKNKEVVLALREIAAGKVTADNIRQLEETRVLPPQETAPPEGEDAARLEIKEILEAETSFNASLAFEESSFLQEQQPEPEQERDED